MNTCPIHGKTNAIIEELIDTLPNPKQLTSASVVGSLQDTPRCSKAISSTG